MFPFTLLVFAFSTFLPAVRSLGICRNNQHTNGSWVERPSYATKKSFYCCGRNGMSVSAGQNVRLCGADFSVASKVLIGSREFLTQVGDDACSCDIVQNTRLTLSTRERYRWRPKNCGLLRWNSGHFCDLLGSRRLLFLGDSTLEQIAVTLMSLITAGKGKCAHQVMHGRSNYLAYDSMADSNFTALVSELKPDICIMNAGAHVADGGDLWNILDSLGPKILKLRHAQNITFVWKTQSPGHPDCDKEASPLRNLSVVAPKEKWFQWALFPEYDEIAKSFASTISMPVMDVSPLRYRPDAHVGWHSKTPGAKAAVDCLHFCMPGPLDLVAEQLLTMLHNKEI